MTSRLELDRDEAQRLLELLVQRLRADGVDAHVHVVGGVAVGRIVPDARLTFADADELIAMKLAAGRAQDVHDLIRIVRTIGIRRASELVDIAFMQYGEDNVTLTSREDLLLFAQEIVDAAGR